MTKKSNRDNFSSKTITKIKERAGYICSNPDCRRSTLILEISTETETKYIGVAAHITAAAENGPRYDKSLTPEERASAKNGILLCANCATLIDKNKGRDYSKSKLRKWKWIHDIWLTKQQKRDNQRRRKDNHLPLYAPDGAYPFIPKERASGYIIVPENNDTVSSRFVNVKGRIEKTVAGSTYWIAISPQRSFDRWWPQDECILMEEGFWIVENATLGRNLPEGYKDTGRRFDIALYETLPDAHNSFQEAKNKDTLIQNSPVPFEIPSLVNMGAFLLWRISVTRTA